MKTTARKQRRFANYREVPQSYRQLCDLYLPRPIHDDREEAAATELINALAVFERLNSDQRDYLDALTEFVLSYGQSRAKENHAEATGLDALKYLLEEHGLSGADLARILEGSRNLGSMILRGDRQLTIEHVRKLARYFQVRAEVFI
jgi:HTH-type transcriptional regulator/antitoxin HigA